MLGSGYRNYLVLITNAELIRYVFVHNTESIKKVSEITRLGSEHKNYMVRFRT